MSSQIILNLTGLANKTGNITITPDQYFALKKAILASTVNFGEICLAVGFVIGAASVYLYYKDKKRAV